jgi:O-antigen ligase
MLTKEKIQRYALYLLLFSLNFETIDLFGFGIDYLATKITLPLFLLVSVITDKSLFSLKKFSKYLIPLFMFFILQTIMSFLNKTVLYTSFFDFPFFINILLFIVIVNLSIKQPHIIHKGMYVFVISTFLLALFFSLNIGTTVVNDFRFTIFNINANELGVRASISLIILFTQFFDNKKKRNFINIMMFLFLFKLLVATGSRTAFISLMLSLLIYLLFNKSIGKIKKQLFQFLMIIVSLFMWELFFKNSYIVERLLSTINDNDLSSRDLIWVAVFQIFSENYFFGLGKTGYNIAVIDLLGRVASPHNVFLEVLSYTGVVGLFIFFIFLYRVLKTAFEKFKKDKQTLPLIFFLHILVMLFSGQVFAPKFAWVLFAYIVSNSVFESTKKTQSKI